MNRVYTKLSVLLFFLAWFNANAQNNATVFNPADPLTIFPTTKPAVPATDGNVYKWGAGAKGVTNNDDFKAYIYNGMQFRLRYPKDYNPALPIKYPAILFLHGGGERASDTNYDNFGQLSNGGIIHNNAVISKKFDGFLIYPQIKESTGSWGGSYLQNMYELLNILVANANVDVDRINIHGLSLGGAGTVEMIRNYPKMFSSALPMSAIGSWEEFDKFFHLPIWMSQGGLDTRPSPSYSEYALNELRSRGANITYSYYPNLGHGVWNDTYANPDFFPYMNRAHKANPLVYFGRTKFCPGDAINVTLGFTPGFDGYEWRKDGILISGANLNTYIATQLGTYEGRIKRGTTWSPWSPTPVILQISPVGTPPTIVTSGLNSAILPSVNGATSVTLEVPIGYELYEWRKVGSPTILSSTRQLVVSQAGDYVVKVREQYGCSSNDSQPFKVISANAANGPDAISNLIATSISKTQIRLSWNQVANPINNETGFEVYRSKNLSTGFQLIKIVAQDSISYNDQLLDANTDYYYIIRAINNNAASTASATVFATTQRDDVLPTVPTNLKINSVYASTMELSWGLSTDDVGVEFYDIYINGVKTYSTEAAINTFKIDGLVYGKIYTFQVFARDFSGNLSEPSNQVSAKAINNGFKYKYYEFTTAPSNLPDFSILTPVSTGNIDNISLSIAQKTEKYGIVFEGFINIPVAGSYTFETNSDDGSKLYIGPYNYNAIALVNNDGSHGTQFREGTITLTKGIHPISVAYFQGAGGQDLKVYWKNTPIAGISSRQQILNSYFTDDPNPIIKPDAPSEVNAVADGSTKTIITWVDNSTSETGFEILRSVNVNGPFVKVGGVAKNFTSFNDSNLQPSTLYFYQVKAISASGESAAVGKNKEFSLQFNNNFNETSGFNRRSIAVNGPTFTTSFVKEGSHAVVLDGVNDYVDIGGPNPGYLHTAFSERSISFWYLPQLLTQARQLLDIGSYGNGIALRTNADILELGIAGNSNRATLSTTLNLNTWVHIAVVYSVNSLKLFKDGVLINSISNLPFNNIDLTSDGSRIGFRSSSNALNINSNYYTKGVIDDFFIMDVALTDKEIKNIYLSNSFDAKAKTDVAAPAPDAPNNVLAQSLPLKRIKLTWLFNNASGIKYAIYKSVGNNTSYNKIIDNVFTNGEFIDSNVVANSTYYYKLKAISSGGESPFSQEVSATALNSPPILASILDQSIRFDQISNIPLSAIDIENDNVTFSVLSGQSFASISALTTKTANLVLSPSASFNGPHNFQILATDSNGGKDTAAFTLTVGQNYRPLISTSSNIISISEGSIITNSVALSDQNSTDILLVSLGNTCPPFVTLNNTTNSSATLNIKPGFSDSGVYNFWIKATDQNGGYDSTKVVLTVTDKNPSYKVYVNFTGSPTEAGYWNNTAKPQNGLNFSNFKNEQLQTTTIGLQVTSAWEWYASGDNFGVYSGASYPLNVTWSSWNLENGSQSFKLIGLDPAFKYSLSFLSSSQYQNGITKIASGAVNSTINPYNNVSQLATLEGLQPNGSLEIPVTISSDLPSGRAHISALIITAEPATINSPVTPRDFVAAYDPTIKRIKLGWTDQSFDESGFEIYRANANGVFTLIATTLKNAKQYLDSSYVGNSIVSYKIRAINEIGASSFSPTIVINTPNRIPSITSLSNIEVNVGEPLNLEIIATDDATDILSITGINLPGFVSLSSLVANKAILKLDPKTINKGVYNNVIIRISDDKGGFSTDTVIISVVDKNQASININFNYGSNEVINWNNFNSNPTANLQIQNLKDTKDIATTVSVQLMNAWSGANVLGVNTGNNSGIFPDNVMKTFYYDYSNETKIIKVKGLSSNKKYNFDFFASWKDPWTSAVTKYSIGTTSVVLDPANNSTKTVKISGVSSNSFGEVSISVDKEAGSTFAFIGALVIESYNASSSPSAPGNLFSSKKTKTSITLNWDDLSDSESGFEVYRSSTQNGTYSLVSTLPASSITYTNTGLISNTQYWYKVRAIKADGGNSAFSAILGVSTISYSVAINFNRDDPAPAPWNNTNKTPADGDQFGNLKDDNSFNTSITMTMVDNFSAVNNLGVVTSNNSGKYPDVVNKWFYYSEKNETTKIKFSGLNQTIMYDFEFFGSWFQPFANGLTSYTINGKTVLLDPANNTLNTTLLNDIKPDQNGNIFIDIFMPAESNYAFLNALTLHAHNDPNLTLQAINQRNKVLFQQLDSLSGKTIVYPNPFDDKVSINLKGTTFRNGDKLNISLVDLTGRILQNRQVTLSNKEDIISFIIEANISSGVYILKINNGGDKNVSIKLLKK